jgi:hypothetical protein
MPGIGYHLFGWGRLPTELRTAMQIEGMRICIEGARARVTLRSFRGLRRFASWRRRTATAGLAVSAQRLAVILGRRLFVHAPLDDPRLGHIEFGAAGGRFRLAFDAGEVSEIATGRVEVEIRTPQAAEALRWIEAGR